MVTNMNLAETEIFKGISNLDEVLKCLDAYEKTYKKSEVIYHAGDRAGAIGLVTEGGVNIVVNYYWGGSNIFGHIYPGQIFAEAYALAPERELLCDVVAAEDTKVLFFKTDKILSDTNTCVYKSGLIRNLLKISSNKNLGLSSRMMHTASKLIRDRLLSYFSEQALLSGTNQFTIPFSRKQLADYLGVERSALSNELSKMKRDGLIDYEKNSFKLMN